MGFRKSFSPLLPLLYRSTKRAIGLVPPGCLRFRPFGIYEILLQPPLAHAIASPASAPNDKQQTIDLRWASTAQEATSLQKLTSRENIAAWNGSTRRVLVAWQDDRPIGCVWMASQTFSERELGIEFQLKPDEVWLYAASVTESLRGQGIYQCMLSYLINELATSSSHTQRILLGIAIGNEASLRAHNRQGARPLGVVFCLRAVGLNICHCRGNVRRLSGRFHCGHHPIRLTVD